MNKLPVGLGQNIIAYYASADREYFCLKTPLENASDSDIATSHAGCSAICSKAGINNLGSKDYAVCSD
jgi:hypothetical protein